MGHCTRGCLVDTCTGQHNMQEDTSSPLTVILDWGTDLIDVCKIQGLIAISKNPGTNLADFWKFKDEVEVVLYSIRFKLYNVLVILHVIKKVINFVWKKDIMSYLLRQNPYLMF